MRLYVTHWPRTRVGIPLCVDGPEDGDEEEDVLEEEGAAAPHAEVRPGREEEGGRGRRRAAAPPRCPSNARSSAGSSCVQDVRFVTATASSGAYHCVI